MSELESKVIKNSIYGLLLQIVMIPLHFLLRKVLLEYIGVELVGISGTVTSLVGILGLAEGGFGSAISYCLYKPVVDGDHVRINQLMSVFKKIYTAIGCLVIAIGLMLSFFIKYIFNGVEINELIYIIFYLECLNSAISYFLCYRRTLMSVNMHSYISNRVDICCNVFFTTIGVGCVYFTHNYVLYLAVCICRTLTANIIIHVKSNRMYNYLQPMKVEKSVFGEVINHSKKLFWGTIAAYIYNSTDNILISSFSNTINVGYLSNYTMITNYLKVLTGAVLSGVTPAIGQIQSKSNFDSKKNIFCKYAGVCNVAAMMICVPTYILLDEFIGNIYGMAYQMDKIVSVLLVMIVYIYIVPFPYGVFITTAGKFDVLKRVEMIGAIGNLMLSLILVQYMGLNGVLLGTIFSTAVQWWVRAYYVYKDILRLGVKHLFKKMFQECVCALLVVLDIILMKQIVDYIIFSAFIVRFIVVGLLSELVVLITYSALYHYEDRIKVKILSDFLRKAVWRK